MIFKKKDDEFHFWAGMIIFIFTFIINNFWFSQSVSAILSFILSFVCAISKEIYDLKVKKTKFEWRDVKWTLVGSSIPTFLFTLFDIIYFYSEV